MYVNVKISINWLYLIIFQIRPPTCDPRISSSVSTQTWLPKPPTTPSRHPSISTCKTPSTSRMYLPTETEKVYTKWLFLLFIWDMNIRESSWTSELIILLIQNLYQYRFISTSFWITLCPRKKCFCKSFRNFEIQKQQPTTRALWSILTLLHNGV